MKQQASPTPQVLAEAFVAFNEMSEQLAASYRELEGRVAQLTDELATARQQHSKESNARERVANRLETLLNALPGGVIVLDSQGVVQECNPAAAALLGEPLLGARWNEVIQRAFSPRRDDGHEVSLVDGRRVSISTCPLGSEPGQILLITDVTEMRRLQDRFSQHQRLATMGEMAASLAHQVRTPLSSALLYTSNLKRPQLAEAERSRFTEKLLQQLRHLEHLVNDMLLYARDGKMGEEEFNVEDLLNDIECTLDTQIRTTNTAFRHVDDSEGMKLHGNRQMLASALCNIVTNALQAMGDDGDLTVNAAAVNGDAIEIRISDTGPGIARDQREKVFTPFYTTRSEGTGLGLAVVAAIVRAHSGQVRVEQPKPNTTGTTVVVQLPARLHTRPGDRRERREGRNS